MPAAFARLDAHNVRSSAPDGLDRLSPHLASGDPAPDLVLPAVAGQALARRAALPAAVVRLRNRFAMVRSRTRASS